MGKFSIEVSTDGINFTAAATAAFRAKPAMQCGETMEIDLGKIYVVRYSMKQ